MDLDGALKRYLSNPDVARWLFSTDDIRTVTPSAMAGSFVYAIGWGMYPPGAPRAMNIEDMLIVTGRTGNFLLGVVWGLAQPHVFAKTPLMLNAKPLTRRFAVDFSPKEALEFMEFASFQDGRVVVMGRQFLHTLDQSLPCLATATLHAPSGVEQTLGKVLMKAQLFEAACCPRCAQVGKACLCSFDSYAPNAAIRKSVYTWNQYSGSFMGKARVGIIKLRMTAMLPDVGELRIVDDEIPVLNVMQRGDTEYMNLLRTKAVHGLGVTVVMPRTDTLVMAKAIESDFVDLHNSYMMRKRVREDGDRDRDNFFVAIDPDEFDDELEDSDLLPEGLQGEHLPQGATLALPDTTTLDLTQAVGETLAPTGSESIESVEDIFKIFPSNVGIAATSPRHLDVIVEEDAVLQQDEIPAPEQEPQLQPQPQPEMPAVDDSFDPFGKEEPEVNADLLLSPSETIASATNAADQQRTNDDFVDTIELILSPPNAQTQTASQPLQQDQIPVEMLTTSTVAGVWSTSVSSENSTREVPPPAQANTRVGSGAKRKKTTAKRSKPQAAGAANSDVEKKHACTTCPSRFKNRGDLLRHIKTVHKGEKMYTCETCGTKFGHSGHLNRHIQSKHLNQRRFECQFCGYKFYQASHLQSHIRHIHTHKKTISCMECGYRASSQNALKNHIADVHGVPQEADLLRCPFTGCAETFASEWSESDLTNHIRSVHGSIPNDADHGILQSTGLQT